MLNTLKNPRIRHLGTTGADWLPEETPEDDDEEDDDDDSSLLDEKNGFSICDIEEEDSKDEEKDESVEMVSLEVWTIGATGRIGDVKHGLVKVRMGVEGTSDAPTAPSKLNLESSVDGDGSSTTAEVTLIGSPRAFGRCGSPESMAMVRFPF